MQEVDGSIPFSSTIPPAETAMITFVLILLAAASRLLPHPPNFAPVAAIGLFAGAVQSRRAAWLVPFAALLASDVFLGLYKPVYMFWNYLAFGACLLLG